MNISISETGNNSTTTLITVVDENTIAINGEVIDLSVIPNGGSADGEDQLRGKVTKDDSGVCTLTVLMKYIPSDTKWNGQELFEQSITDFNSYDASGNIEYDSSGNPVLLTLGIMDFTPHMEIQPI